MFCKSELSWLPHHGSQIGFLDGTKVGPAPPVAASGAAGQRNHDDLEVLSRAQAKPLGGSGEPARLHLLSGLVLQAPVDLSREHSSLVGLLFCALAAI